MEDFLRTGKEGLFCLPGSFHIDPKRSVNIAVISHAHADHAVSGNRFVYCTPATRALMTERYGDKAAYRFIQKNYGEVFVINGVKVSFYPAGHILGSAQVLMEHNNTRYLYTGDFKLQKDQSCEEFVLVQTDILITESTFARPEDSHPDPVSEITKLNEYRKNILIGAYSLGKAQRVTDLLSRYCPEKQVVVHSSIGRYHKIYREMNFSPGKWLPYSREEIRKSENIVYIVPPAVFLRYKNNTQFLKAFATGWDHTYPFTDFRLTISDHADWKDILELIKLTGAKKVFTVHGEGGNLRKHFYNSGLTVDVLA
jgi:putative mRNA 3-end processing factor